jgi:citrate lyase subunit beta/citryl-CoA lyase
LNDEAVIQRECAQGLRWGFDGKTLIHPSQIAVANAVFTPSADEIAWARTITAAFGLAENAGKGALKVDGKMVELLHLEEATRTLAIAEACAG